MQEMVSIWIKRLRAFAKTDKARKICVIGGVVGMLFLVLPEIFPKKANQAVDLTIQDFIQSTEERLRVLVGSIDGVGECRVMVTLENGVEYIYATEERNNSDRQEDVSGGDTRLTQRDDTESAAIIIETDSGREGLLVTEIQPTVRGVVIVCEGGDNEQVRDRVSQAVTVALNISQKRVCVTKLS